MIHRAPFGSLERLIGILIEQYAGVFPLWLAPEQVRLLTVSDDHMPFAQKVAADLQAAGVRVTVDQSGDRLGKKIRNAEKAKIPVMSVIGDKEVEANSLNIRTRVSGELGAIPLDEVKQKLRDAIATYGDF
jgi:threonyl-tRNA synthetase